MHTLSTFVIFLLCYLRANEAQDTARFLGIFQRFNDSTYDSYYFCGTSCEGEFHWRVGNDDAGQFPPDTIVGRKQYITSPTDSSITFFSVITAVHDGNACVDSVLIATQTNQSWRPPVMCRRRFQMFHVQYDSASNQTFYADIKTGAGVKLALVPYINDITSGNAATQFIICQSNDSFLSWSRDMTTSLTVFSDRIAPGNIRSSQFMNSPLVRWDALVLGNEGNKVTSLLIWTNHESQESFSITCRSGLGSAMLRVDMPEQQISTTPSTTDGYSMTTLVTISTPNGAGSGLVSCYSSVVFLLGISWMYMH